MAIPHNTDSQLRVMVDANVLIAGTVWPRFPYEVLRHATSEDFQLVLLQYVIDEAQRAIARLAPSRLSSLGKVLTASKCVLVPHPTHEELAANSNLVRDIADIPIALAAIESQVDYLVTQDRDFTDRDDSTKELHQKLNILLPGTFLREHMGWLSEQLEAIRKRDWPDVEG